MLRHGKTGVYLDDPVVLQFAIMLSSQRAKEGKKEDGRELGTRCLKARFEVAS